MKANFVVQHDVLSGLKYIQVTKRKGIRVAKNEEMIVSCRFLFPEPNGCEKLIYTTDRAHSHQTRRRSPCTRRNVSPFFQPPIISPLTKNPIQSNRTRHQQACWPEGTTTPRPNSQTTTVTTTWNSNGHSTSRRNGNETWLEPSSSSHTHEQHLADKKILYGKA